MPRLLIAVGAAILVLVTGAIQTQDERDWPIFAARDRDPLNNPEADATTGADSDADASFGLEAWAWLWMREHDQQGRLSAESRLNALRERAVLAGRDAAGGPSAAGVTPTSWQWVGPTNYAGRIRTLVIHPTRTTHLLAGSASGGIWKSEDAGQTWRPINDFLASLEIRTLAVHPQNPEVVYAGTGEFSSSAGVLRSADFGETWQQIPGTETMNMVRRLEFASNGVLYAGTLSGVYRVHDAAPPARLLVATIDDVEVSPADSSLVVAVGSRGNETVVSRSTDGGATWMPSSGLPASGVGRIEVAFAPSDPAVLYGVTGEDGGKLYKSVDGGRRFVLVFQGPTQVISGRPFYLVTAQSYHNLVLWVNPFDPGSLFAGGVGLYKSTDGGLTWTGQGCPICFEIDPNTGHFRNLASGGPVDYHEIVADPGFDNAGNRRVYAVFDQGVYRVENLTQPAVTVLNQSLGTMQFYAASGDPGSGRIIAGSQDTGVHVMDPEVSGDGDIESAGDGGPGAIDPRNPNLIYLTTQFLDLTRKVYRSRVNEDFAPLTRCSEAAPYRLPDACTRTTNFIAPMVMDPGMPDRLYAGGLRLWRTDNAAAPLGPGAGPRWLDTGVPFTSSTNYISAIEVSPHDSRHVWVARNSGELYRSLNATDAEPQWTRMNTAYLPGRQILDVAVSPHDAQTVYLAFSTYAANNIWRTVDGGVSWQAASGAGASALPSVPVNKIAVHPSPVGAHWLYAATAVGLFTSEDGGASWGVPTEGPSSVRVHDLFWMGQTLYLATHGRSIWRAAVGDPTPSPKPGAPVRLTAVTGPRSVTLTWDAGGGAAPSNHLIEAGSTPGSSNFGAFPSGSGAATFAAANVPLGNYVARVRAVNAVGTSLPSNEVQFTVLACVSLIVPAPPHVAVNGLQVTLTWASVAGTSYLLQAGSAPGASNFGTFPVGGGPSFSTTAPPGVYYVRLIAQNSCATSAPSSEVMIAVQPPILPGVPASLAYTVGANGAVSLSWSPPPDRGTPIGYVLEAGSQPGLSNLAVIAVPAAGFSTTGVPRGTYFVRVRATNAAGTGPPTPDLAVIVP